MIAILRRITPFEKFAAKWTFKKVIWEKTEREAYSQERREKCPGTK